MQIRRLAHPLGIVISISALFALPLLWSGFPPSNHDSAIHAAWTHHASAQFWNGSIYPRYFPELNHNYGSPSFFFYPPISTFASALFWPLAPEQGRAWYALGWSAALGLVLSGVFMWIFLQRFTGHRWAASVGASLYVIAPYHLGIDLLGRGANAEFWAFAFMPLVLLSFHRLSVATSQEKLRAKCCVIPSIPTLFAAFSLGALFCCHVLTAITFAPVALGYALFLGRATFLRAIIAGFWSLLLSAVYLLPAATYSSHISGANDSLFLGELIRNTFFFPELQLNRPFLTDDPFQQSLFVVFVSVLVVLAACFLSFTLRLIPEGQGGRMLMLLILLQFCVCMMLPISEPLYAILPPLRRLQFAWRFLSPATFLCATLISVLLARKMSDGLGHYLPVWVAASAMLMASCWVNIDLYRVNYLTELSTWRTTVPSTGFKGLDAFGEYVPLGASIAAAEEFFEEAPPSTPLAFRLISGDGKIAVEAKSPRRLIIQSDSNNDLRLVLHQFWLPGWVAKELTTGEAIPVTRRENSGLLEMSIPKGRKRVELRLSVLRQEALGIAISTVSGAWLLGIMAWRLLWRKA